MNAQQNFLPQLLDVIGDWIVWLFGADGPIIAVINFIVNNPFMWVFLGLGLATMGIKLLSRIRRTVA